MPRVECPIHTVAARTPNAVVLVSKHTTLTYAAFDEQIARYAGGFRAIGVRPGSRVAIFEDISIENVAILPALWRLESWARSLLKSALLPQTVARHYRRFSASWSPHPFCSSSMTSTSSKIPRLVSSWRLWRDTCRETVSWP